MVYRNRVLDGARQLRRFQPDVRVGLATRSQCCSRFFRPDFQDRGRCSRQPAAECSQLHSSCYAAAGYRFPTKPKVLDPTIEKTLAKRLEIVSTQILSMVWPINEASATMAA